MRLLLPLAALVLAACSDPSLGIELVVPEAYRAQVQSASLAVVVPPQGEPFTCDELAFGVRDADAIRANTVEEVLLLDGASVSLDSIPREGTKLLVARGFAADGEQLISGCVEVGDIGDDERITIVGEVVTVATIPAFNPVDASGRRTDVLITDALGQPARGIEVRWTRTSPGQEPISESAVSSGDGLVLVEIEPPPLPGPVSVDVRARWARSEPPIISGFREPRRMFADTLPNPDDSSARNPDEVYQVGRIGPNGEMGLAAMGNASATSPNRQVYLAYFDPSSSSFQTVISEPLPATATSLALLTGDGRDRVFSTSIGAILEVLPDGSLNSQPLSETIGVVRRFLPLGDCSDPEDVQALLVHFLDGSTLAVDANGTVIPSPFSTPNAPGQPLVSGCLSSDEGLHRAVAYLDQGEVKLKAFLDTARTTVLGVVAAGIGFSRGAGGADRLLLATTLGIEGTDIQRFGMLPVGSDQLAVEAITSDATPTFAQSITSGDFDGDGLDDIAAVLVFGDTVEATDYRLYVSLGLESSAGRVAGVSQGRDGQRPRIFVRDFDGDGHDDILVASNGSFELFDMARP